MLGGPERAGMEGLGEAPSASRADEPGQLQVETLGRGRSADCVAHALAERAKPAALVGPVEARPCERAGSPFQAMARAVFSAVAAVGLFVGPAMAAESRFVGGTQKDIVLTVEIENEAGSDSSDNGADIISAHVEAVPSAGAPVTNIRVSPAVAIPVGQTKTFTVTFDMAGSPNDGDQFTMTLRDIIDDAVDPAPRETLVLFEIDGAAPTLRLIDDNFDDIAENGVSNDATIFVGGDDKVAEQTGSGIAKIALSGPGINEAQDYVSPYNQEESVVFPISAGSLPEGDYAAIVQDALENTTTRHFTIDRTPPVVTLTDHDDVEIADDAVTPSPFVTAECTDAVGIGEVSILTSADVIVKGPFHYVREDGATDIRPAFSSLPDNEPGKHYVLKVVDLAGNVTTKNFTVRHAPLAELRFSEHLEFDYVFDYYGVSVQQFSIPQGKVEFALQDDRGISRFTLKKNGAIFFDKSYPNSNPVSEPMILSDGVYEFTVGTERGQTTGGVFTKYTSAGEPDFRIQNVVSNYTGSQFDISFPIDCRTTGPAGTGLSEVQIRTVNTSQSGGHSYGDSKGTFACGGRFSGQLSDGLYAVSGDDHGYEINTFFRIESQIGFLRLPASGSGNLEFYTNEFGADGLILPPTGLGEETVLASGNFISHPVDLFIPSPDLLPPLGAVAAALLEAPSNAVDFKFYPRLDGVEDVIGFTGISQSFAVSNAGGEGTFHAAGTYRMISDGAGFHWDGSDAPHVALRSPVTLLQSLTSNTGNVFGRLPFTVTPIGGFPQFPLTYLTANAAPTINDLPTDSFSDAADSSGRHAFRIKTAGRVTIGLANLNDPAIKAQILALKERKIKAAGSIILVDPPLISFNQPAEVEMSVDTAAALAAGVAPEGLELYQAEPGGEFVRVPNQMRDLEHGVVRANIFTLSDGSLFGLFGTATPLADPDDVRPPRTTLSVSRSLTIAGKLVVGSTTSFTFKTVDDKVDVYDLIGSGSTQTFVAFDGGTFEPVPVDLTPVASGTHTFRYFSRDVSGNSEVAKSTPITVDKSPPVSVVISSRALFAVNAVDAASSVAEVRILIDVNPSSCNGVFGQNSGVGFGTCENSLYTGAFPLTNGPRTVWLSATDFFGNVEAFHSTVLDVVDQQTDGGLGIGRDSFDSFWNVIYHVDTDRTLSFARADSSGTIVASAPLEGAAGGLPWSVFFDAGGRAYAVGSADGGTGLDVGVYKASESGDAIESRLLFDSGFSNNDYVFDAAPSGWITGGAQYSGLGDGGGEVALALWRFDPSAPAVTLSTLSARTGFDFGTGLGVDADGSVWIAGYSMAAGGGFDFSLWHYAADGRTPVGVPIMRPGYLDELNGGVTAKVFVASDAVFIAAPKTNAAGVKDLAFMKFDKATGLLAAESVWRSGEGEPAYPVAILPEAAGLLVAGGIGGDFTQAALWRFGYDGALHSATTADAGGAKGAVFRGSQLWLSVDGSSVPYKVESETPAAGGLIDVRPPRTSLTAGTPSAVTGGTTYVSSETALGFSVADDKATLNDGLGVGATQTFFAADGGVATRFTAPFSLVAEGTHAVSFFSVDLEGNTEVLVTKTVGVDLTAPAAALVRSGTFYAIDAVDPVVAGAASGIGTVMYLVDASPSSCSEGVDTAAARGTCLNPFYGGPFELSIGTHTVYFEPHDQVGNGRDILHSSYVVVGPADTTPPLARLDYPAPGALGVERAVGGVVNVRGAVSDENAVSWALESAPGAGATSGFAPIAAGGANADGLLAAWDTATLSGERTLRLRATDASGNASSTTATVFVGEPVFTFSIGRKDSNVIVDRIKNPTAIAVRSDGLIWVASAAEEDELLLLTSTGAVAAEAAGGRERGHGRSEHAHDKNEHGHGDDRDEDEDDRGFKNPQGLALDAANSLYIADEGNNRIVKLSADGSQMLLQLAKFDSHGKPKSGAGPGEFKNPWDVAVDSNGDIYVADSGNSRIQVFNGAGAFLRQFGPGALEPDAEVRGITLTAEGLWVSDKESERVYLFSRAGTLIKSIGDADSVVGEISRMRGLASDRWGALYVVEPNRDRAQKFDAQGKGLLAFGSKAGLSQADKKAKRYLTRPIDAATAPDGSIWFTDTGRDRIVRYALPSAGGYGVAAYSAGGGASSSQAAEPVARLVSAKDGAAVERDDGAGVVVPAGALAADLEITVDKGDENQDKDQKTAKRREKKITAVSAEVQYGPEGTTFSAPVTLTVPYDAALIASLGLREDDLKVYYWNPTLQDWQAMPSSVDKLNKTVHAQTTHFSAYQVGALGGIGVAALDDYGLRDGYAFPNPSRDGNAVTFRLQPGSVDSIEVRVYDVAGRKVHSSSDFVFRGPIDDGNGKGVQNTYDHVWGVSGIGSGVYSYVMTAKKAGQPDIHQSGKVGVIR